MIFTCDLAGPARPLPHFWEHTIGSGHATLALRADWQAQMHRAHDELGFRHVRFHGILCDDVGTLIAEGDTLFYSFFNADRIFDFLLSIGMKPFVELSFMPACLASGGQTVFHYRRQRLAAQGLRALGNADPQAGGTLGRALRFGRSPPMVLRGLERAQSRRLRQRQAGGLFQALPLHRRGDQIGRRRAARWAARRPRPMPGSTISSRFAPRTGSPPISSPPIIIRPIPSGKPGDDTEAQLAQSRRSVLRDETREVRRQAGERPVYYTEWCTSSNPRDPMHDEPYAAAFIVKTILEANGLVQGYSYWTFSDIFEENYFPSVPFHGGFGLLNIHGIAKPAYRAFELLHALGERNPAGRRRASDRRCLGGRGARMKQPVFSTNFALAAPPDRRRDGPDQFRQRACSHPGDDPAASIPATPTPNGVGRKWARRIISTPPGWRNSTPCRAASPNRIRSSSGTATSAST